MKNNDELFILAMLNHIANMEEDSRLYLELSRLLMEDLKRRAAEVRRLRKTLEQIQKLIV